MIDTAALVWGILLSSIVLGFCFSTAIYAATRELKGIKEALITIEYRLGELGWWQQ